MSEEIIIDGVDVSGCAFYKLGVCISPINKSCKDCNDIDINKCYYKQLKRLQAENEELKHKNEILLGQLVINDGEDITVQISQSQFNEYNELKAENERLKEEIKTYDKAQYEEFKRAEEYKKALEEIREYLQQFKKKKSNFYTLNDVITDISDNIEKIISEVLDERN